MYTSSLVALLTTPLLLPPFATSLTLPKSASLITPPLTIPITNTTLLPSSLPLNPTTTNSWPPSHTWPPPPFTITIPSQTPPAFLNFLHLSRPGLKTETDALLSAIDTQLARYDTTAGLPGPFTIVNADVRFRLRLATPKRGESWLSRELAIAALEVFKEAVAAAGAREGMFLVESEDGVKGTVWVLFVDAGVGVGVGVGVGGR